MLAGMQCSFNTGPISEIVVSIINLHTKTWGNGVKLEKYRSDPLILFLYRYCTAILIKAEAVGVCLYILRQICCVRLMEEVKCVLVSAYISMTSVGEK